MEFNPLPLLLAFVGSYFMIKLRFFFILHPIRTISRGLRAIKEKRVFRSFSLALAGTLGVGNVFGVALGIMIGGPGSLFWLFISMFFAMVIKYCEVVIAGDNLHYDIEAHGGIYYVIRSSFKRYGRSLSLIYSVSILFLSLVMGGALQSDAVIESSSSVSQIPTKYIAFILVMFTMIVIIDGTNKIEKITAIIVPLTTIIYIFITLSIILMNIQSVGTVANEVVQSAFLPRSAFGGVLSFLMSMPIREGFARGLLSNEAGAGTSSMAHSRSGVLNPSTAGILGIFEVWFDTGLICMLTGFSILLSVPDVTAFDSGMHLVIFSVGNLFGSAGKYAVIFCVFAFAFATVICWYYYGLEAWSTIFGRKWRILFLPLFLSFVYIGCFIDTMLLIIVTDALMLVATLLTVSALIKNSDRIRDLSEIGGVIDSDTGRLRRLRIRIKENVFWKGERHR